MTERQYVLQHLLHLSSRLSHVTDEDQRKNLEDAILFYARQLKELDARASSNPYIQ